MPTLIAQQLFQSKVVDQQEEEALGAEDPVVIHHRPGTYRFAAPVEPVGP